MADKKTTNFENVRAQYRGKANFGTESLSVETPQDEIYREQFKQEPEQKEIKVRSDLSLETPQDVIYREEAAKRNTPKQEESTPKEHVWMAPGIQKKHATLETPQVNARREASLFESYIEQANKAETGSATPFEKTTEIKEDTTTLNMLSARFEAEQREINSRADNATTQNAQTKPNDEVIERKAASITKKTGALGLVPKGAEELKIEGSYETPNSAHIIQQVPTDNTPAEPLLSKSEEDALMNGKSSLVIDDNPFAGIADDVNLGKNFRASIISDTQPLLDTDEEIEASLIQSVTEEDDYDIPTLTNMTNSNDIS